MPIESIGPCMADNQQRLLEEKDGSQMEVVELSIVVQLWASSHLLVTLLRKKL